MRHFFTFILTFIVAATTVAQHCQYDVTALLGVVPVTGPDSTIVNGLRITLVDTKGAPVMHEHQIYSKHDKLLRTERDTQEFWRNPPPNKDVNHMSENRESRHFSHASNHYILLLSSQQKIAGRYIIKIEDTDGVANGGLFQTVYAPIHQENIQSLCNYFEPHSPHNTRNYVPVYVIMVLDSNGGKDRKILLPQPDTTVSREVKPAPVRKNETAEPIYSRTAGSYRFEVILNPGDVEIPAEKGSYARKILVYHEPNAKPVYEYIAFGNRLKDDVRCQDSIEVDDYDFDGLPDFRICSKALQGAHLYFLNRPVHNTFVSDAILGSLSQVQIDRASQRITGYRWVSTGMETYELSGKNLKNVTIETSVNGKSSSEKTTNRYIYTNGTLTLLSPKTYTPRTLSKTVLPFRFTLEINPNGAVSDAEQGNYEKILRILDATNGVLLSQLQLFGNSRQEDSMQSNSLDISDFNFDGLPDIRIYDSKNLNRHIYVLSNAGDGGFYQHRILSNLTNTRIDAMRPSITGELRDDYEISEYTFYGPGLDTLWLKKRYHTSASYHSSMRFLCKNNALNQIAEEKPPQKPVSAKKEFNDYNFDEFEDFRISQDNDTSRFSYYLFDPKTRNYVYDSVFSAMDELFFNREKKTITGSITTTVDLTTTSDGYEWRNGTFVNVRRTVTTHLQPNSEEVWVEIYELKDGVLKLIDAGKIN